MKSLIYKLSLPVLILLMVSCEKILEIDLPESKQQIAVNSIIEVGKPISINVMRTRSVFSEVFDNYVTDATVEVFEDGKLLGSATYESFGWYKLSSSVKLGAFYQIKVSMAGKEPIIGETKLPNSKVQYTFDTLSVKSEWGEQQLRVIMNLIDDPIENNYYLITSKIGEYYYVPDANGQLDSNYVEHPSSFYSEDPSIISSFSGELIFSDETFINTKKKVEGQFWKNSNIAKLAINVCEISEAYYKYKVTFAKYFDAEGNPLAEPVQVFSNVKGGVGLVGSMQTKSDTIYFKHAGGVPKS